MAGGYYVVLVLGAVAMLAMLIRPVAGAQPRPVRVVSDRSRRRYSGDRAA
jgi:hypothetical protein